MELTREQQLFHTILKKAWEDSDYKKWLMEDPISAIEELTGETVRVPEGKTMVVCDQTDESKIFINIPAEPDMDDMELTEEQLEIIAGGGDPGAVIQTPKDPLGGALGG
jgi:hypothetical protein